MTDFVWVPVVRLPMRIDVPDLVLDEARWSEMDIAEERLRVADYEAWSRL